MSVSKLYWSQEIESDENVQDNLELVSRSQKRFFANKNGYVFPVNDNPTEEAE